MDIIESLDQSTHYIFIYRPGGLIIIRLALHTYIHNYVRRRCCCLVSAHERRRHDRPSLCCTCAHLNVCAPIASQHRSSPSLANDSNFGLAALVFLSVQRRSLPIKLKLFFLFFANISPCINLRCTKKTNLDQNQTSVNYHDRWAGHNSDRWAILYSNTHLIALLQHIMKPERERKREYPTGLRPATTMSFFLVDIQWHDGEFLTRRSTISHAISYIKASTHTHTHSKT